MYLICNNSKSASLVKNLTVFRFNVNSSNKPNLEYYLKHTDLCLNDVDMKYCVVIEHFGSVYDYIVPFDTEAEAKNFIRACMSRELIDLDIINNFGLPDSLLSDYIYVDGED